MLDAGLRIAGTSSLGLERYIVLAENKNTKDLCLVDIKAAHSSSVIAYIKNKQPVWSCEAQRVLTSQKMLQYQSQASLGIIQDGAKSFVIKELQPSEDKMDIDLLKGNLKELERVTDTLAQLTASAHLRGSGRQGAAITDELIAFAGETNWPKILLAYTENYTAVIKQFYKDFCVAYEAGYFKQS